jgi:4-hydroxy-tetrahydrodipicolinate reductase
VTRIIVHGAGRMARRVLAQLPNFEGFELLGLVSRNRPEDDLGVDWHAVLAEFNSTAELLIDFTLPGGTRTAAQWCACNGVALLSGTTGLTDGDIGALRNAALKIPVLWAPNLSHGMALMTALVRQMALATDPAAAVTITDIHHRHKLDAPSGTALALAAAVQESHALRATAARDTAGFDPVFSSVREGEVVGEHTVRFTLPDEVLEITHKALDRDVFARGALKAAEWLVRQPPGYYSSGDWLGLR